jgi:hypothetical protein
VVYKPPRNSIYRYKVVYPKEMESVCAVCDCKLKIIAYDIQQSRAKHYCHNPCTAKRMSPVKLLWSENWTKDPKPEPTVPAATYLSMLRASKGITEEAINGLNGEGSSQQMVP